MTNNIVNSIFNFVISVVNFVLQPIDEFINTQIPSLAYAFELIDDFFDMLCDYGTWVLSYSGLYNGVIVVVVDIIVFALTATLAVYPLKLAISWFSSVKE